MAGLAFHQVFYLYSLVSVVIIRWVCWQVSVNIVRRGVNTSHLPYLLSYRVTIIQPLEILQSLSLHLSFFTVGCIYLIKFIFQHELLVLTLGFLKTILGVLFGLQCSNLSYDKVMVVVRILLLDLPFVFVHLLDRCLHTILNLILQELYS